MDLNHAETIFAAMTTTDAGARQVVDELYEHNRQDCAVPSQQRDIDTDSWTQLTNTTMDSSYPDPPMDEETDDLKTTTET